MVSFGKWFQNPEYGESRDPNGLYGILEAFGRAGLPQNPTNKLFLGDFPYFRDFGVGPLAPLCIPYWPFVG